MGVALAAGNIDAINKWAWGTNVGWLNFAPDNGGVTVYGDHLEGYAWGENVGWIRLGAYTGGGSHTYANEPTAPTASTNGAAPLRLRLGHERRLDQLRPQQRRRDDQPGHGRFDGYAWGENVGWIHFQNGSPAYKVNTTWRQAVSPSPDTSIYLPLISR